MPCITQYRLLFFAVQPIPFLSVATIELYRTIISPACVEYKYL